MNHLILVTGDKGGVGKSFTSRVLLDYFLRENRSVQAFDTDKTNSTLFRFYQEEKHVKHLDFESVEDLDSLLNSLNKPDTSFKEDLLFLIDCAARSLDHFIQWMKEVDFLNLKTEMGFKMTLVFVLGPEKDCVSILKDVTNEFKDSVHYLILKNLGRGSQFSIYENSNTKKLILEKYDGIEMELGKLLEKTSLLLDRWNLSFEKALTDPNLQIADRSRVRSFREQMKTKFSQEHLPWI